MAIIVAIMASVEPQQTVICSCSATGTPCRAVKSFAMASRSGLAPQVTAYWLMSPRIAWHAASLIACGAGKSGKPCDRLTALCFCASRVISRITLSENDEAFCEILVWVMATRALSRIAVPPHSGLGEARRAKAG